MVQLIEQGFTTINEIAEEMRMPRRATRKVLYQMNKERILGYERVRIEGKITFKWFLTPVKMRRMIRTARKGEIRELEERIEFEQDHKFFQCHTCKGRCLYTEAMDFGFVCERCGEPLEAMDNEEIIEKLKADLAKAMKADDLDDSETEHEEVAQGAVTADGKATKDIPARRPARSRPSKRKEPDKGEPKPKDPWSSKPEEDDDDPFKEPEEEANEDGDKDVEDWEDDSG